MVNQELMPKPMITMCSRWYLNGQSLTSNSFDLMQIMDESTAEAA